MSNQVYSTGRRKESIAKVWVSNGTGNIIINKKKIEDYFPDKALNTVLAGHLLSSTLILKTL